eukprot:432688_1
MSTEDISFPDTWPKMKAAFSTDELFDDIMDLAPKNEDGTCRVVNLSNPQALKFTSQVVTKIQNQFLSTSRKIECKAICDESTVSCIHELWDIDHNENVFVDGILNELKSYINYAHKYSNDTMLQKHYAKTNKQKRKYKPSNKHKHSGQNPLNFKQILFGPSSCFIICNKCVVLFFIKSRKLRDLLDVIHTGLRSQYIEFEYVLNTVTWFVCKLLLNPLVRKAVFNDNFMMDYYLQMWHKLWLDNKYYYLAENDATNSKKKSVFKNVLSTMFYNMNYALAAALANFKYRDIDSKLIKRKSLHWQRILAYVTEQAAFGQCAERQRFINQDDDMFYNLGNIVMKWIMVYGSGSSKQIVNEWFRVDRWKKEAVQHYVIENINLMFRDEYLSIWSQNILRGEFLEKGPLNILKHISNISKSCINKQCRKAGFWFNKSKNELVKRKLFVCKSCKMVYYCCRKCQKYDWNRNDHRKLCKLLQVQYSSYLVFTT